MRAQFEDVAKTAESRYWPYPLVLINGQVALAGDVNVYRISSLVQKELQP